MHCESSEFYVVLLVILGSTVSRQSEKLGGRGVSSTQKGDFVTAPPKFMNIQ